MASNASLVDVTEDGCAGNFNAVASPRVGSKRQSSLDITVASGTLDTDRGRLRNRKVHHGALLAVGSIIVLSVVGVLVANFSHVTVASMYPVRVRSLLSEHVKTTFGVGFTWLLAIAALVIALLAYFGLGLVKDSSELSNRNEWSNTKFPPSHDKCIAEFKKIKGSNAKVQENMNYLRTELAGAAIKSEFKSALKEFSDGDDDSLKKLESRCTQIHEIQHELFRLEHYGEFDTKVLDRADLDAKLDEVKSDVKKLKKTADYHRTERTVVIEVVEANGLDSFSDKEFMRGNIDGFDKHHNLAVKVFASGLEDPHETKEVDKDCVYEDGNRVVWNQAKDDNHVETRVCADDLVIFQLWDNTWKNDFIATAYVDLSKTQLPHDCHLVLSGHGEEPWWWSCVGLEWLSCLLQKREASLRVRIREV